jgi:predicted MFS family arabinose efflux permease
VGSFTGAVAAFALFAICESRSTQPLLPLRLFRSVSLSAGTVLTVLLMFSLFGSMFFMTFFMENVRGLDPVMTGVRLVPLTGMLIVGAPLAGLVINKIGPRVPMVTGMLLTSCGLFGLSRLGVASGPDDTIIWFVLVGLGLSPVIVGGADVIVGNAPVELAGVAGGLTSTAMQVGGTLGTSVLGAVMSAKVDDLLPVRWAAAHLPTLTAPQSAQVKGAVSVGAAPVAAGTPRPVVALVTHVAHATFMSGLDAAFLVAAIIALVAAAVALLVRSGQATDNATAIV